MTALLPFLGMPAVVDPHVAAAAAKGTFAAIAGLKQLAAFLAWAARNDSGAIQDRALAREEYRRVFIDPISEGAHASSRRDLPDPCRRPRLAVFGDARLFNAGGSGKPPDLFDQRARPSDRSSIVPAPRLVGAAVTVEDAAYEMVRQCWDESGSAQFPESFAEPIRAEVERRGPAISHRVARAEVAPHPLKMRTIHERQPDDDPTRWAAVCVEEAKPISLSFGGYVVEEGFVQRMMSGACHGAF